MAVVRWARERRIPLSSSYDNADRDRLNEVMERFHVDTVYHAAAYKHVPLVEQNIIEGVCNNVLGTLTLGELVLTCTGSLSRNRQVGQGLGRGLSLADASAGLVAEGVRTTRAACALAEREGIEMPIAGQMKAVLYDGKAPREALEELMLRSLKRE